MTILSASSGNGRCSALASSHGARIHTSPLFVGREDHRHGLRMDRLDHRVRRCREKTIDLMRPPAPVSTSCRDPPLNVVQMPAKANSGRASLSAKPDDILFLGLRVRLRRILGEAVDRDQAAVFPASASRASCGDDVLRMLVTGGPPCARVGGGMPHRISTILAPRRRCSGPTGAG